jgi:hypothetical protein
MLVIGGIFSVGGAYLTGRDFVLLNLPSWLWLTIGVFVFVISITGILYQFQRQFDLVVATVQKGQTSNFPKLPSYSQKQKQAATKFLDESIRTVESLKSRIEPHTSKNLAQIRSEITKLENDTTNGIWKLIPEYNSFLVNPTTGLDDTKYIGWYKDTAYEAQKIDGLLFKLKEIRLNLQ